MKNKFTFIIALITAFSLSITLLSCKKKTTETEEVESGDSVTDSRSVQGENDAAINDVNDVIGNQNKLHGRGTDVSTASGVTGTICGLSIDTTGMSSGSITLNYNGTTCNNRTRTGTIKVSILNYFTGKRWKNAGTSIIVQYVGYKITRASDGKFIKLDGSQIITNQSGGSWWELIVLKTQSSLVTTIGTYNGPITATFDDNTTATYNINRVLTYSYPNNIITCTADGNGSADGINHLENFGTTRAGESFKSEVSTPIVWNLTCGWGAPLQGVLKVHDSHFNDGVCTFGVDKDGNAVTVGANQCAYGLKIEWTDKNSKARSQVFAYK